MARASGPGVSAQVLLSMTSGAVEFAGYAAVISAWQAPSDDHDRP
jgi:hypothetical protein